MIAPNGTITVITSSGGGYINGKPQRATAATSEPIPANIAESSRRHGGMGEQTTGTKASYTILVDAADAPTLTDRDKVELFDFRGLSLGKFEVQSAQLLNYVDAVKIIV